MNLHCELNLVINLWLKTILHFLAFFAQIYCDWGKRRILLNVKLCVWFVNQLATLCLFVVLRCEMKNKNYLHKFKNARLSQTYDTKRLSRLNRIERLIWENRFINAFFLWTHQINDEKCHFSSFVSVTRVGVWTICEYARLFLLYVYCI